MHHAEFNLVVLISGNGSNLQAIIDAIQDQTLPATLRAVISDRPGAFGLSRAVKAHIPTHVVDYKQYPQRADFDKALMQQIDAYSPDLVVLAGFMRILTTEFVQHYTDKMINVHPSLLPKYQGLNTHQRVLDAGEQTHGASVHYVTPELDSGPLILQGEVPVFPDDSAQSLQQRVHAIEHKILPAAIRLIASGQVSFRNQRVYYGDKPIEKFQLDSLAKQL